MRAKQWGIKQTDTLTAEGIKDECFHWPADTTICERLLLLNYCGIGFIPMLILNNVICLNNYQPYFLDKWEIQVDNKISGKAKRAW